MKAVICKSYGPTENLRIEDIPVPEPKAGEVLLKVKSVPVNDYDWCLVRGKPFAYRTFFGFRKPKNPIPGMEVSGIVEAVGPDSNKFAIGDEVYGDTSDHGLGSFAEYMCVSEEALIQKPKEMSFEEAASISHASNLAVQGLVDLGGITEGQKVLINGGGGGVGLFSIQLTKMYNCHVTGVDTGPKLETMKEMGYDEVLDYKKTDFTRTGVKYDLVLDCKSNRNTAAYLRALNKGGQYITVGGRSGKLIQLLLMRPLVSFLTNKKVKILALKTNKDLPYINRLYEAGKLKCFVDGPYPLEKSPWAIQYFGEGKHTGKVIVSLGM